MRPTTSPKRKPPKAGRGILYPEAGFEHFRIKRERPSSALDFFVEHYWFVEWDLRGRETYVQETLPYPSVHIATEPGRCEVFGVVEGRFSRHLDGKRRVFGIKFVPGGFEPFLGAPVCELTNRVVPLAELFGAAGAAYARDSAHADDEECCQLAERLLLERQPEHDPNVARAREIVEYIAAERSVTRVEALVPRLAGSKRPLQRLFKRYVGVSPKWVVQRYRLHEALEHIRQGQPVDWAALATDLGYFDQAHFIKEFKRFVGRTPDDYSRRLGTTPFRPSVPPAVGANANAFASPETLETPPTKLA